MPLKPIAGAAGLLSIIAPLLLSGCGEDPELVRKREEQRARIKELEGELEVLRERIDNAPPDRSGELAELKAEHAAETEKIAELEREISEFTSRKNQLERELADYKSQHPLR